MDSVKARLKRLKAVPFLEAAQAVARESGVNLPDQPRGNIRCFLPCHSDKTPSFSLREKGWRCFGCSPNGGDALDLLIALEGLPFLDALERIEGILNLGSPAQAALSQLQRPRTPIRKILAKRFQDFKESTYAEAEVILRFYALSPDPLVSGIGDQMFEWVATELYEAESKARTARGLREECLSLERWVLSVLGYMVARVERETGRDLLDVALLKPRVVPSFRDGIKRALWGFKKEGEAGKLRRRVLLMSLDHMGYDL